MGSLPRPDLPPGPHRDLVDALHELHHRAGWPSLRVLAAEAGCSHTTVSAVFSSPRLPSWGVLELLVEAMGGDVEAFRVLWRAAGSSLGSPGEASATSDRIAGRVTELATMSRHLRAGTPGMLLVTGEAGIGKTRLVGCASVVASGQTFVASGACLPLSTAVPLLPIVTVLRTIYETDRGQWLKEAVFDAAPYVAASLRRLLPELDLVVDSAVELDDEWSRHRLFTAVGSTFTGLAAVRPLAVVIEDLHWADSATLDLLEHLLATGPGVPLVGTWRQDDPSVPVTTCEWFTRVRRLPAVTELALAPLTRDGTTEQLALLTGVDPDPASVDRIHRRTAGQPLFTEQLVAQSGDDQPLPDVLADLLDRRLDGLDQPSWRIARALGIADRPLTHGLLSQVTTLASADLAAALHQLVDRRLLRDPTGDRDVELRHPLLAEAIRRRLVWPESVDVHRRIAAALADTPDPAPSEVAEHWQRAEDPVEEIGWRIRAALAAGRRFAWPQESEQWLRVLELWPDRNDEVGVPPVTRAAAYLAAMEALKASMQFDRAAALSDEAISSLTEVEAADWADLLTRAAEFRGASGSPAAGLELLERALEIFATLPPSVGYVAALQRHPILLLQLDRFEDAYRAARFSVEVAQRLGVLQVHRKVLARLAWFEAEAGDVAGGLQMAARAYALVDPGSDPPTDIWIGVLHTDLLLRCGAGAEDVEAAGGPLLALAARSGIDSWQAIVVRSNISEALTRAGLVGRAAAYIDPVTETPFDVHRWPVHLERATLDALRGRLDAAHRRFATLRDDSSSLLYQAAAAEFRACLVNCAAQVDLWDAKPEQALSRIKPFLEDILSTAAVSLSGPCFVLAARASADLAEHEPQDGRVRAGALRDLMQLRARTPVDPFTTTRCADGPAHEASWHAETARLAGQPTLELWGAAVAEWDKLSRPHDAAYCRWRGAQVALSTGQGTTALRLLRRAASEAREHVPLSAAIADTTEKARRAPQPR